MKRPVAAFSRAADRASLVPMAVGAYYVREEELAAISTAVRSGDPAQLQIAVKRFYQGLDLGKIWEVRRQLHSERSDFAELREAVRALRMPLAHQKSAYRWVEPRPAARVPDRLSFRSLPEVGETLFQSVIDRAHEGTLDRVTSLAIDRLSSRGTTRHQWLRHVWRAAGRTSMSTLSGGSSPSRQRGTSWGICNPRPILVATRTG